MEKFLFKGSSNIWPNEEKPRLIRLNLNGSYSNSEPYSDANTKEKFNNAALYIRNNEAKQLLDKEFFPEVEIKNVGIIITNDGIVAFKDTNVLNNDEYSIIIYDSLAEDKNNEAIDSAVINSNKKLWKLYDPEEALSSYYVLSINNGKFLPYKISEKLFHLDCDECWLDEQTKYEKDPESNLFKIGENNGEIVAVGIKRKSVYNIRCKNVESIFLNIDDKVSTISKGTKQLNFNTNTGDYIKIKPTEENSTGIIEIW